VYATGDYSEQYQQRFVLKASQRWRMDGHQNGGSTEDAHGGGGEVQR